MRTSEEYRQLYSWGLISYHSGSVISKFVQGEYVSHYAYILHDKENAEPHWHILVTFKQRKSLKWIQGKLDEIGQKHQNTLGEEIKSRYSAYQYLTHENSEKQKYEEKQVITDKRDHWTAEKQEDNRIACILEDFDNHVSLREMALKYGRDFVVNYQRYYQFHKILTEEESKLKGIQMEVEL